MIYLYFDGNDTDHALMETIRDCGDGCCNVLSPRRPTEQSINEHMQQSGYGAVVLVLKSPVNSADDFRVVKRW